MGLAAHITRHPVPHDAERGASVRAALDARLSDGALALLIEGAAGSSPYLARLLQRHGGWLADQVDQPADATFAALINGLENLPTGTPFSALATQLRETKGRAALLIALADLGGVWDLQAVTGALTRLADCACETGARHLMHMEIASGKLPGLTADDVDRGAGYFLLAMGKMGAGELNYSSDIDLIALFDDARFDEDTVLTARSRFIHVTRQLVKLLSENTGDGYVFRTDLRLRPSPSTTAVCMARDAAERYYESVGRTWERAAHIKARPLVDRAAGEAYLQTLAPFVWRRNLDFAALDDIHDMLRKIREQRASFTPGALPGRNIKLDPGGIREIEFFAQTRQLIMGGRQPALRVPTTLGALDALTEAGLIKAEQRDTLAADYVALRTVEHRLQMMEDAQTHIIPASEDARARLAALCGETDLAAFERDLADRLARVHDHTEEFFGPDRPAPQDTAPAGSDTAPMLSAFDRPDDAARQIERWRAGQIPATRSERARHLFQNLEPQIVEQLSGAANPDQALAHFDRFLSSLPAGVQVFSLFTANPKLLDLIVAICAAAPRLALYLGRHAHTLDALLDRNFWEPVPETEVLLDDLNARLATESDYERTLDTTRRWAREVGFRTGVHVLRGISQPAEAGAAYTRIAETCVRALLPRVTDDFATRHGPPPGTGLAVIAMGRLGSGEMTATSDLDLITVYDAAGVEHSEGPRPLAAQAYYPRLTQALISALTAPTAEGVLYEVDMRLRPSGNQGPVAVGLSTFQTYQIEKAWVWEHLALTRARVIAGPVGLQSDINGIIEQALATRTGQPDILTEAATMRTRLIEAAAGDRTNPWSLKHTAGGLMEIEFLAQTGVLIHGLQGCRSAARALPELARVGWFSADETEILTRALDLQQALQHIERVALDGLINPDQTGAALIRVLVDTSGADNFDDLQDRLRHLQSVAADICAQRFDTQA